MHCVEIVRRAVAPGVRYSMEKTVPTSRLSLEYGVMPEALQRRSVGLLPSFGFRRKVNGPTAVRICYAMAPDGLERWTRACSRGSACTGDNCERPRCAPKNRPTISLEQPTWVAHGVAAKRDQRGAERPWSRESPFEERSIGSGRMRTPEDEQPSPTP